MSAGGVIAVASASSATSDGLFMERKVFAVLLDEIGGECFTERLVSSVLFDAYMASEGCMSGTRIRFPNFWQIMQ